ncbi:unnamed protein product, partial [Phaeothamnion confervicola]
PSTLGIPSPAALEGRLGTAPRPAVLVDPSGNRSRQEWFSLASGVQSPASGRDWAETGSCYGESSGDGCNDCCDGDGGGDGGSGGGSSGNGSRDVDGCEEKGSWRAARPFRSLATAMPFLPLKDTYEDDDDLKDYRHVVRRPSVILPAGTAVEDLEDGAEGNGGNYVGERRKSTASKKGGAHHGEVGDSALIGSGGGMDSSGVEVEAGAAETSLVRYGGGRGGGASSGGGGRRAELLLHLKGDNSRHDFFQSFQRVARQRNMLDGQEALLSGRGRTPRQVFLRSLLRLDRAPLPVLLRERRHPGELNLAHRGLGDDIVAAVACVLPQLPETHGLDVTDNRLTAASLVPLCRVVAAHMPRLRSLNLSENKVDSAAGIVRDYLKRGDCRLRRLVLRSADVDDDECCSLMGAVAVNISLECLDVSRNGIGGNENLNVLHPDLVTGGEAVADMLERNCHLRSLDLSWNCIRLASACAIGRALLNNSTLTELNLAYNAFADVAAQELGDSLACSTSLVSVDVSYNGVTPAAAMVIGNACKAHPTLTRLNLDGNSLGRVGSAAVMTALRKSNAGSGSRVLKVSMSNCNCDVDPPGLFNAIQPTGEYCLDMSLPYSRMVVRELIALAETKQGFEFASVVDDGGSNGSSGGGRVVGGGKVSGDASTGGDSSGGGGRRESSSSSVGGDANGNGSVGGGTAAGSGAHSGGSANSGGEVVPPAGETADRLVELLTALLNLLGLDPPAPSLRALLPLVEWGPAETAGIAEAVYAAVFRATFILSDADGSEALEMEEMRHVFRCLGVELSDTDCRRMVAAYDIDRNGRLEREEFVSWCMIEYMREPEWPKGRILDAATMRSWQPPRSGLLKVDFVADRFPSRMVDVESDEGLMALVENLNAMRSEHERYKLFENAIAETDMTITCEQAEMLCRIVARDENIVATVEKLLPQIVSPQERALFIERMLTAEQRLRLAVRMRHMFRAVMGSPTGFYMLDLSVPKERWTAIRLSETSNNERAARRRERWPDTSQKGNGAAFRNETL